MAFKRADRVAGLLREEISKIFQFELKDPRLGFVTVTDVRVSDDLRSARIYFGILGDAASRADTLKAIEHASAYVRREIAQRMGLRRALTLTFTYDETAANAARIDTLLREIGENKVPPATEDEGEE